MDEITIYSYKLNRACNNWHLEVTTNKNVIDSATMQLSENNGNQKSENENENDDNNDNNDNNNKNDNIIDDNIIDDNDRPHCIFSDCPNYIHNNNSTDISEEDISEEDKIKKYQAQQKFINDYGRAIDIILGSYFPGYYIPKYYNGIRCDQLAYPMDDEK